MSDGDDARTIIKKYVWTAADADVASRPHQGAGGYPQCDVSYRKKPETGELTLEHICFVTPYGIAASALPEATRNSEPGTEVEIPINSKTCGAPWRASRFHVANDTSNSQTPAECRWVEVTVPESAKNLDDLCRHLMATDPELYPARIYGMASGAFDARKMIFDHWYNSAHRSSIVSAKSWDWRTYSDSPGTIGPSRPKMFVPQLIVTKASTPVAPNGGQVIDVTGKIHAYIKALEFHTSELERRQFDADIVLRRRLGTLRRFAIVRAILECPSDDAEENAKNAQFLQTYLRDPSERHPGSIFLESSRNALLELPLYDHKLTNITDMLNAQRSCIDGLLYASYNVELVKDFAEMVLPEVERHTARRQESGEFGPPPPTPALLQLLSRLTTAMGRALHVLTDAGVDQTRLEKIRADAGKDPAQSLEQLSADTPLGVIMQLVGKGGSLALNLVGNLEGPPSLAVAVVACHVAFTFPSVLKSAGNLEDNLVKKALDDLPTEFQAEARAALVAKDQTARDDLYKKVVADRAGKVHSTTFWKGAVVILQLLSLALAIDEQLANGDENGAVMVLDWAGIINSAAGAAAGVAELALRSGGELRGIFQAMDTLKAVNNALGTIGNVIGFVGALIGIASGIVGLVEAYIDGDGAEIAKNTLTIVGSTGMAIVAAVGAIAGTSAATGIWPLTALSIACLIAAAVVDFMTPEKHGKVMCIGILRAMHSAEHCPEWALLERTKKSFGQELDRLIQFIDEDLEIPSMEWTEENRKRLRDAGLPEDAILSFAPPNEPPPAFLGVPLVPAS